MEGNKTLINFHIRNELKEQLDASCHILNRSRTSVLIDLIEAFIIDSESKIAQETKRKLDLQEAATKALRFKGFLDSNRTSFDDDPPMGFHS